MKYLRMRFGLRRRVMYNAQMERKKEQEAARREYERQAELRPEVCAVVTFKDIEWLKEMGIEWTEYVK